MTSTGLRPFTLALLFVAIAVPIRAFSLDRTTATPASPGHQSELITEQSLLVKAVKESNNVSHVFENKTNDILTTRKDKTFASTETVRSKNIVLSTTNLNEVSNATESKTPDSLAVISSQLLPNISTENNGSVTSSENVDVFATTTINVDEQNVLTTAKTMLKDNLVSDSKIINNSANRIDDFNTKADISYSNKIETKIVNTTDKPLTNGHTGLNTVSTDNLIDTTTMEVTDKYTHSNDLNTNKQTTVVSDTSILQTIENMSSESGNLNTIFKDESTTTTESMKNLQGSTEDKLLNNNQPSTVKDVRETITETMTTSDLVENSQSDIGTVTSMRAGFLDFSKRTTAKYEISTTDSGTSYKEIYDVEAADVDPKGTTKLDLNSVESQRRQAEDMMREEELINENIRSKSLRHEITKIGTNNETSTEGAATASIKAEDALSVQPINQDRKSTLYAVGPNYKPMKRLEVQPAKQLVRDPDDNSWRNESISSLGIVFKPKNSSSKSFKEVLKTKNEMELNNLQERDSKEMTPELRTRLEKITEVRKRKKKIDKFGETVYSDYEEGGSAEGAGSPRTEPPAARAQPATTDSYWRKRLEAVSREDVLRDLGVDVVTARRPGKPFNPAEYYDTTDDYDAEYVTMPSVDLKRFTDAVRARTHATPAPPAPARFPERRPTVHYFPPTTRPPALAATERDLGFERRERPRAGLTTRGRPEPATTPPPRGSFAVRHLGELLSRAAAQEEEASPPEFPALTQRPAPYGREKSAPDYEYESPYRRELMAHFVESFNRHSERFREDFPVLLNASVERAAAGPAPVGGPGGGPRGPAGGAGGNGGSRGAVVELSPAYELHYFVPEQEEAEAAEGGAEPRDRGRPAPLARSPYVLRL